MWTSESVKKFFDNEKILICDQDVLPIYVARFYFGDDAVDFVRKQATDGEYGFYGIDGNKHLEYLSYKGVQVAATHNNVCEAQENMKKYCV